MISVYFQGKPFSITVIRVYAPTTNAEEAETEWFYEEPTRPSRTNTPQKISFSSQGTRMQKLKVKRHLEAGLAFGVQNEAG